MQLDKPPVYILMIMVSKPTPALLASQALTSAAPAKYPLFSMTPRSLTKAVYLTTHSGTRSPSRPPRPSAGSARTWAPCSPWPRSSRSVPWGRISVQSVWTSSSIPSLLASLMSGGGTLQQSRDIDLVDGGAHGDARRKPAAFRCRTRRSPGGATVPRLCRPSSTSHVATSAAMSPWDALRLSASNSQSPSKDIPGKLAMRRSMCSTPSSRRTRARASSM